MIYTLYIIWYVYSAVFPLIYEIDTHRKGER